MLRYNPFCPGSLVPPGVFTGRYEESCALERMLFHTKHENPQHFLLHGERGIGKSSLLYIHGLSAAGEISGWDKQHYNFLTITVLLEPADNYDTIVRKLGAGLRRRLAEHEKTKEYIKTAWEFLKHWEIMGVKYTPTEAAPSPSELLDELVHAYARTCAETADAFDGILIMIDEADKPAPEAHLGTLLKGFTERLARERRNTVCLGVAGVNSIIETLRISHESALRIFTTFHLRPLSREESIEVIRNGLRVATEKNGRETTITSEAEALIALYSEGYPHFIQQFAYCAFEADKDWEISEDDVKKGAWGEHGAFQQLGTKYFEDLYFDRIGSDDYRQVLRVMSDHLDDWVSKDDIRSKSPHLKQTTLDNALKALTSRRIILPRPGHRGIYPLPMKSFAAWIRAYTSFPGDPGTASPPSEAD